jgi:hypothetical protein
LPDSPRGNKFTANHCTAEEEWDGGSYYIIGIWAQLTNFSQDTLFWGLFLEAREDIPKIIFEGDSKTTNPVVAKSYEKPYLSSSFFYQCHPYFYLFDRGIFMYLWYWDSLAVIQRHILL